MKITGIREDPIASIPYKNAPPARQRALGPQIYQAPIYVGTVDRLPDKVDALFCLSDFQGRGVDQDVLAGVVAAEELEYLADRGVVPPLRYSVAVLAGDFFSLPGSKVRGGLGDVYPVWEAFEKRFGSVMGVMGNHDTLDTRPQGVNTHVLDANIAYYGGLRVAGISGIIGKPTRPNRRPKDEYFGHLKALATLSYDLVVLHEAPEVGEAPEGRRGRSGLSDALQPFGVAVCGHVHYPTPLHQVGNTQVLNVDGRVVVLTEAGRS